MNQYNRQIELSLPFIKNNYSDCVYLKDVNIDYEKKIINLLTQKELAKGWRQVLPKAKNKVVISTQNNLKMKRNIKQYLVQKINLAQLPDYLWDKLELNILNSNYKYNSIKDNILKYNINETPVDEEIIELRNIINSNNFNRIIELLQILEDNNITGWLVIKAKNIIGNSIQVL